MSGSRLGTATKIPALLSTSDASGGAQRSVLRLAHGQLGPAPGAGRAEQSGQLAVDGIILGQEHRFTFGRAQTSHVLVADHDADKEYRDQQVRATARITSTSVRAGSNPKCG